jgi:hypothetical protein
MNTASEVLRDRYLASNLEVFQSVIIVCDPGTDIEEVTRMAKAYLGEDVEIMPAPYPNPEAE